MYEFKHNFYSKLYAAMEKKNKTYKDLSTDLGKNLGYISRIMSGKIEPSFSMIFYIAEAAWKGAGLKLESAITIRYEIEATDLTRLKAVLSFNGKTYEVDAKKFETVTGKTNRYAIYFDELLATQMSTPVLATIYRGDKIVSNTVQYSVESYVKSINDSTKTDVTTLKLKPLVKEMIKYGYSAYAYSIAN